ncbi:MAG: ABC transporter permease [Bacillota bacterium]
MFIRLGVLSIIRQLSRSALALISLVLAAVSLTANLTISSGYPALAYANYRHYLGGDIVVYPVRIMTSPDEQGDLQLYRLAENEFSTLTMFYPHVSKEGFLSNTRPVLRSMTQEELDALQRHPEVMDVSPLYRLPAWRSTVAADLPVAVRALKEGDPLEQYLLNQVPAQELSGVIPVWLNSRIPSSTSLPEPGAQIKLTLPTLVMAPDGSVQIDDTRLSEIDAQVAGYYALPTRSISWPDGQGGTMTEQGYFNRDEIWVRASDWQAIWQLAAPTKPPMAFSCGVIVKNMGFLESVSGELQLNNPQFTVVSAPNLARVASQSQLIDHFQMAPKEYLAGTAKAQLGFPQDMGRLLSLFIYLNAGLLMAARMLTGAAARRKEIGILKAIGARRRDIMLMAITEAVTLSVIGSTVGFVITYAAALLQQLTNHVAFSSIILDLLQSYGVVMGQTVAIGLVFGLMPAWRLSKMTVNEVLRS